ncbi:Coatomer subunit beta [Smittium mucronatum]|uniref:Coatomer subunit beta n=1 Tax=Smittium mucronatum TaxID=133383 RepID=A0A1R0H2V5_9FUNG|nr:Coatomer subunit beta [Smittium mucronatum]
MSQELVYSLVDQRSDFEIPNIQTLKRDLERGTDEIKLEALQKIIVGTLNGEKFDSLFMIIIRFVMPTKNKILKKHLLFYWEVCPKYDESGKLRQETILICNSLLNDLHHSNEYIQGATLRFLCRLKDSELLEPLIGPARECLNHRHAYVRRNAVLAIHNIYKVQSHLIPDAPEMILSFLSVESDSMCKRNAVVMLTDIDLGMAVDWLLESLNLIEGFESNLQLSVIELIRKAAKIYPQEKPKFIRIVFELLSSDSSSVKFEAASSLVALTNNSAAIKAVGSSLIHLVIKESNNNVKLVVLERLDNLRQKHEGLLDDLAIDLLQILSNSDLEVKRRSLDIVMKLTSQRNASDVVGILKKHLIKTLNADFEKVKEYRELLVQTIHACAVSFPEVAADVAKLFLSSIGEFSKSSAADAISFVREVIEKFPLLRSSIINELHATFPEIKSCDAMCRALWILGEYSFDIDSIKITWENIKGSLGDLPLLALEEREALNANDENPEDNPETYVPHNSTRILPDGTYATESYLVNTSSSANTSVTSKPPIRALLFDGQYFLGAVLANTLVKLVLRFSKLGGSPSELNQLNANALLAMIGTIRIGQSSFVKDPIDEDSYDRILACIRALEHKQEDYEDLELAFLDDSLMAFSRLVKSQDERLEKSKNVLKDQSIKGFDSPMEFRLLAKPNADQDEVEDLSNGASDKPGSEVVTKLDNIVQLTGFSDPVYAEAYLSVHQYDITIDILIVNQTNETLKNLNVEFSMMGDLKLIEKPRSYNVSPKSFSSIKATVKVSSADSGVIYGNLTYDGPGPSDTTTIIFNDINIDIMEYIRPAYCDDAKFFSMWSEFEWENKVDVNTKITDLQLYLSHLASSTNMAILTPDSALEGDCGFLAANLYSKSIFGEDALLNVSLEKVDENSSVTGHIRIRSKSQGIALSLGDKINSIQNNPPQASSV